MVRFVYNFARVRVKRFKVVTLGPSNVGSIPLNSFLRIANQ